VAVSPPIPSTYVANNTVLQITRSSAAAERPRDASCHWIFC